MLTAEVNHITRLRINSDGAGVRSVVFMQNCPLDCFWCCNPETRYDRCGRILNTRQFYDYIKRDMPYYLYSNGGITFSGGEPLLYTEFIEEFAKEYCGGISVDIETGLYADWTDVNRMIPLIAEWFIDFKVFDNQKHVKYTGKSNSLIKQNLTLLAGEQDPNKVIICYPVIPGYNTSDENIKRMAEFLTNLGYFRICLHPYRKMAEEKKAKMGIPFQAVSKVEPEMLSSIERILQGYGFELWQDKSIFEKEKCVYLKQIRKAVANERGIPLEISDCTYEGPCTGTCPRCEKELKQLLM